MSDVPLYMDLNKHPTVGPYRRLMPRVIGGVLASLQERVGLSTCQTPALLSPNKVCFGSSDCLNCAEQLIAAHHSLFRYFLFSLIDYSR